MGTEIKEIVEYTHICDTCNATATTSTTELPEGWFGVGSRSIEFGIFDVVLCGSCTDIAALVMLKSQKFSMQQGMPWTPSDYFVGNVSIAASWDNAKCPECKEPWSKGDPLRHSDRLGKWVHDSCA